MIIRCFQLERNMFEVHGLKNIGEPFLHCLYHIFCPYNTFCSFLFYRGSMCFCGLSVDIFLSVWLFCITIFFGGYCFILEVGTLFLCYFWFKCACAFWF